MKKCKVCGTELDDDSIFCPECGAKQNSVDEKNETDLNDVAKELGNVLGNTAAALGNVAKKAGSVAKEKVKVAEEQYKVNTKSTCAGSCIGESFTDASGKVIFNLSEGEVVIKSYNCTRTRFLKIPGYMTVTNKRVVYHSNGIMNGDETLMETHIEGISSLNIHFGLFIHWIMLLISVIVIVFGYQISKASSWYGDFSLPGAIVIVIGIVLLILSFEMSMICEIKAPAGTNSTILLGKGISASFGAATINASKGIDSALMKKELGAIILDLQQMGDLAVEKWKNN